MISEITHRQTQQKKNRVAAWYGLLAGLAYSTAAWGFDAARLAMAHAIFPWLQFGMGALIFGAAGALAAWLSYRINRIWVSFVAWLGVGVLFARLCVPIQFQFSERILQAAFPAFTAQLAYPMLPSIQARLVAVTIVVVLLAVVAGMLSITLIENSAEAGSPLSMALPMLVWIALFGLAGYTVRDNFTAPLVTAVTGADEWAQFALEAQTTPVDSQLAKEMRLRSAEPILDLLAQPRRLLLVGYNDWLNNMNVLILFGESRVYCAVVDGMVNFCERGSP